MNVWVVTVYIQDLGGVSCNDGHTQVSNHDEDACMTTDCARARVCRFFAPFEKGGTVFVDGAVFANNPAEIAIAEANIIWNFPDIDLVVSVGTGLTNADASDDANAAPAASSSSKKASKRKEPKGDAKFQFGPVRRRRRRRRRRVGADACARRT
jgi:hypothetical protein